MWRSLGRFMVIRTLMHGALCIWIPLNWMFFFCLFALQFSSLLLSCEVDWSWFFRGSMWPPLKILVEYFLCSFLFYLFLFCKKSEVCFCVNVALCFNFFCCFSDY